MAGLLRTAHAAEEETPDQAYTLFRYEHNKIFTDHPFPVQPGKVQVKPTYTFLAADHKYGHDGQLEPRPRLNDHAGLLFVTTGLADRLDATGVIGLSALSDKAGTPGSGSGVTDFAASSTYQFYSSQKHQFAMAYLPTFIFPTGQRATRVARGPSQNVFSFDNRVAMNLDWTNDLITCYDIGYMFFAQNKNSTSVGLFSTNFAVGYHVTSWLQPEVEINYLYRVMHDAPDGEALGLSAGLIFPLSSRVRIDAGAQHFVAGRNIPANTIVLVDIAITF